MNQEGWDGITNIPEEVTLKQILKLREQGIFLEPVQKQTEGFEQRLVEHLQEWSKYQETLPDAENPGPKQRLIKESE